MMGDMPSPSSALLADNANFSKMTPTRQRINTSSILNSSSARSPSRTVSSPRAPKKAVTIFDQIFEWFKSEITNRQRKAALCCSIFSMGLFIVSVSVLNLSIWSPFSSLNYSLTWFLSPSNFPIILFNSCLSYLVSFIIISSFCSAEQSPRLSPSNSNVWLVIVFEFLVKLASIQSIFYLTESALNDGISMVALGFGSFVSSTVAILKNDFHLNFPSCLVKSVKSFIELLKSTDILNLAETSGMDAAISFTFTIAFITLFGPILSGFHTWWLLFNIQFYLSMIVFYFTHHFYFKSFMKIVNQIVMRPISFPFPPPFAVHSPTPEQIRNITNVLEVEDSLVKLFALYDLREIAWNDDIRRKDVFSLSQPGGHARNWKSVSTACVRLLDELCSKMTASSARLVGYSWGDMDEGRPKDAIMMPRRAREMTYNNGAQNKNIASMRALNAQNGSLADKLMKKVYNQPKYAISRYEAQINSYAAEAVYMLVVTSMGEDRYGVVQKDLKELITLLCKLIGSIDAYERARASVADKSDLTYLRIVVQSLQSSLQRVVNTFGSHLSSLNLSEESLRIIRFICQIEDL